MYSEGDLLKVLGVTDSGVEEQWYAEVVGVLSDERSLEVFRSLARPRIVFQRIGIRSVMILWSFMCRCLQRSQGVFGGLVFFGIRSGGDGESFCRKEDEVVSLPIGIANGRRGGRVVGRSSRSQRASRVRIGRWLCGAGRRSLYLCRTDNDYVRETHEAVRGYKIGNLKTITQKSKHSLMLKRQLPQYRIGQPFQRSSCASYSESTFKDNTINIVRFQNPMIIKSLRQLTPPKELPSHSKNLHGKMV